MATSTGTIDTDNLLDKTGDVQGTAATALWGDLGLLYEPAVPPTIVGTAAVYVYWGATVATPGFAQLAWAEAPTTWITAHNATS